MKKGSRAPMTERIAKHTRRAANGCLEWTGALNDAGYGRLIDGRRNVRAHRANWELHNGPIPDGLLVLHRCDNPKCVDPKHLFLGTNTDNIRDMVCKGRGLVGEHHGNSRTTLADVQAIRAASPSLTHKELADIFHLSFQQVSRIRRGEAWNHCSLVI